jgi:glycosyltransferase involved in cell wall biosynthesis
VATPVRLVLAGAGVEAFTEERRRVPARHSVVCLPFLPDLRPLYELVDLALLPSRDEGLSQALLEAMALGKPIIASAVPGNAFAIHDGENGLLRPLNDPSSWAQAIDLLLTDGAAARRLGSAARVTARKRFALETTVARTAGLYREVLQGLPAGGFLVPSC